jgi:small subunit ribosomal protein S7
MGKDPRYGNTPISPLINMIMQRGKKNLARPIVYGAIERVSQKFGKAVPMDLLLGPLENLRPKVETKSRRIGGATYQIPVEIPYEHQHSFVFRSRIEFAKARKGLAMNEALAQAIVDASNNRGLS